MVRDTMDRHPKLKRGDSKTENSLKILSTDSNKQYLKVLNTEEKEAQSRSGDADTTIFKEICEKFREIIKSIADLKSKNDASNRNAILHLRVDASMLFLKMKKLNRLEKFRLHSAREKLHDTKRQVDNLHLQWQNLLYETHHLKKEISNCMSFKSKDEHIDLIPVEEFYESAPETITRPEITKKDRHRLRLAQLEWELTQRKVLAETCNELMIEKDKTASEIRKKKDRIENLIPMIKNILSATKPVQEYLGLSSSQIQTEPELAQLLPPPLYFLSIQANAMEEATGDSVKLTIIGDKDSAARFNTAVTESIAVEYSDSEDEGQSHHHRRKTKSQIKEEKIKKLLTKHPLSAKLQISLKDGNSLSITFHHLVNLRIISIIPVANTKGFDGLSCRHLLESRHLLNGLYDKDYGERSPNPANTYQLEQLGIEYNPLELGLPYFWVQKLCGLDFTNRNRPVDQALDRKTNAEQRNISVIVQKVRQHFRSVVDLCEQIQDFEKLFIPMKNRDIISYPVKTACTLLKWELISWDRISTDPAFETLLQNLDLSEYDRFFETIFVRNTAKLIAKVIVKPNYPDMTPVFSIRIENGSKKYNAQNNNNVRDMEKEVNFYVEELYEKLGKQKNWILTAQMNKLAICFDIFLECTDRDNFPREKLFYHHVRGRSRSLPFKFVTRGKEGLFVQR
ncbi:hypothetical protein V9T40_009416 [Parthenolecanium corni]|uniref:THO complex subunit 5 n=1 Tax=Parthenolecanium corni TaxID=536013 RepID=A0AAN9TSG4_9HEMI